MIVVAHMGGVDEIASLLLPALVFAIIYRLAKGKPQSPQADDPGAPDADPTPPTSPR